MNGSSRFNRPETGFEKYRRRESRARDQVRCYFLRCYRNPFLDALKAAQVEATAATVHAAEATTAQAAAQTKAIVSTGKMTAAQVAAAASSVQMTTTIQQAGYMLGDLGQTSGDLGAKLSSVTNNLQFMLSGLGIWGVAAGVVSVAGVSVYRNWDLVANLFEERNPIPPATEALKKMGAELETTTKKLEEFQKRQSLTNEEVIKYNRLTAEQTRLEKAKHDEQQREADLTKLRDVKPAGQESPERAKALQEALANAPDVDLLVKGVAGAMREKITDEWTKAGEALGEMVQRLNRGEVVPGYDMALNKQFERAQLVGPNADPKSLDAPAADLVRGATIKGDRDQFGELIHLMRDQAHWFTDEQRKGMEAGTPFALAAKRLEGPIQKFADAVEKVIDKQVKANEKADAKAETKADKEAFAENAALYEEVGAEMLAGEKAGKKAGKLSDRDVVKGAIAVGKQLDQQYANIKKNTSLDEEAAARLAQMRAEGGTRDARGQLHKRSPEQQDDALADQARQFFRKQGASPMEAGAIASRLVSDAKKTVDDAVMMTTNGTLANTQQLIQVATGLAQHFQQVSGIVRQQGRQIQQLHRHVGHGAETFQNSGGPGG